jgi:hypothetical protein
MSAEETLYLRLGTDLPAAEKGQLFGKPCFKVNGKAFICFFQGCLVSKLSGPTHQAALSLDGAQLFDPSGKGRPMKEWVQVPFHYQDKWPALAAAAYHYVGAGS